MYNDQLYAEGVHSVLLAEWELLCRTPLVIRNGHQIAYSDSAHQDASGRMKWPGKKSLMRSMRLQPYTMVTKSW